MAKNMYFFLFKKKCLSYPAMAIKIFKNKYQNTSGADCRGTTPTMQAAYKKTT